MIQVITKQAGSAAEKRSVNVSDAAFVGGAWLLAEEPSATDLNAISEALQIRRDNLGDALDPNESPHLEHDIHYDYLYIRYAHVDGHNTTTTRPLVLVYNASHLLTVSSASLDVRDKLLGDDSKLSTRTPQTTILKLLEIILANYDMHIKKQSETITKSIARMRRHKLENDDFVSFVLIEDQINDFTSALSPLVPLLQRMGASKHLPLTDRERDMLEDIKLAVEQSIHICSANQKRIVSIREAYVTLSNNSLNRTMRVLAAATMFIALPNVVFGAYGMNIVLPIQKHPWSFPIIVGSTLVSVVLIILLARKRRWF